MSDIKFFKIRHKATGKFYQPVKGRGCEKTNLGPNGKVYTKKPNLSALRHGYNMIVDKESVFVSPAKFTEEEFERIESHFEIVEYELREKK